MPPSFQHTVNADQATFIGFGLEGIAYGIHVLLFGVAASLVPSRRSTSASIIPIFGLSCLLFGLGTVHFALNFNNVYDSTMVHPRPHIAAETHLLAGADIIFSLSDFLGQIVLIYRCYLIWGNNPWIIILPLIVAFAAACVAVVVLVLCSVDPTAPQAPANIVPFGDASFAMSLILNFASSALIVARIWWLSRYDDIVGVTRRTGIVRKATGIIIESGLLFLITQFVFVIYGGQSVWRSKCTFKFATHLLSSRHLY
ncbi:hypothetical protein R3P38DRAFT_3223244 [Favolaschia claudopus]|uniref:Uncharacterized protein n=1 Tax=Favolaschia claudopus TaxID=2862362 RepID=A0AAV9ZX08_9AGAR